MNPNKFKHFYLNKYLVTPFSGRKYFLSYNYQYKFLWFRVAKVASRTMNDYFIKNSEEGKYIYSSEVGYLPEMFSEYFKFAVVRSPVDRFISAWKNKVLENNLFNFNSSDKDRMSDPNEFVKWVEKLDLTKCDEHLRLQTSLIDLENVDFVGKIEDFEKDFKHILNETGMPQLEFESKNKSTVKQIPDLNPNTIQRIENLYQEDIENFYA